MTGAAFSGWPKRFRLEIAATLLIGLSACSFGSLDHLKNGQRLDGAVGDVPAGLGIDAPAPVPDAAIPDAAVDDSAVPDTDLAGEDGATRVEAGLGDGGGTDARDGGKDGGDAGRAGGSSGGTSTRDGGGGGAGGKTSASGIGGRTGTGGLSGTGGIGGTGQSGGQQVDAGLGDASPDNPSGAGGVGGDSGMGGAMGGSGGALTSTSSASAQADASPDTVGGDVLSPGCSGVDDSGICWYLGESGDSCATTCASHGGTSPQAASHVGIASQGGSASECGRLLGLLGQAGTVHNATRSDGLGLGCVVALGFRVWLSTPAYSDAAKNVGVEIVCGCLE